jgi:hypothetical protein
MISCWIPSSQWCHSSKASMMVIKKFIMNIIINFCKKRLVRMKVDRMKKIIFSKLWEYDIYYKVESVHLQDKRFGRVFVNQKWGSHEIILQRLKNIIDFNSPVKRLILFCQTSKKGHHWKISGNEMLIKVSKSDKTLDILNKNYISLMNNGLTLWGSMWMPSLEMAWSKNFISDWWYSHFSNLA